MQNVMIIKSQSCVSTSILTHCNRGQWQMLTGEKGYLWALIIIPINLSGKKEKKLTLCR